MKFEMSNKPLTIFNFSSLTDIVLLLLIFFLLTSQFVVQTGVKVKLPGAQNNQQVTPTKMIVTLTSDKKVFVGSKNVGIEAVAGELSDILNSTNESNVIIRADKSVDIDLVIKVIDAAKGIGIEKFTIETEKETF